MKLFFSYFLSFFFKKIVSTSFLVQTTRFRCSHRCRQWRQRARRHSAAACLLDRVGPPAGRTAMTPDAAIAGIAAVHSSMGDRDLSENEYVVCTHACMYVYLCVYMCMYVYVGACMCMCVCVYVCRCVYVCMCPCMHACICMHMHAYACI